MVKVALPRDIRRIGLGNPWTYLGTDLFQRKRIENRLGSTTRILLRDEIDKVARRIRDDVNECIAALGHEQRDPVGWWSSLISSRDPIADDFLRLAAYLSWFKEWMIAQETAPNKDILVVVEDPWCYRTLEEQFTMHPGVTFLSNAAPDLLFTKWRFLVRGLAVRLYVLLSALAEKASFLSAPLDVIRSARTGTVWNYLFVEERAFTAEGRVVDVYLPDLEALARRAGKRLYRFTNVLMNRRLYGVLRKSRDAVIPMIAFASVRDIAAAVLRIPTLIPSPSLNIHGIPVGRLIDRERWSDVRAHYLAVNLLWYRACRRFLSALPARSVVFYSFENQRWEKLLSLAKQDAGADHVTLVGYQHSSVPWMLLSYFPAAREWGTMPWPDWVLTNSPLHQALLLGQGYPARRTVMAGSMRYAHYASAPRWAPRPIRQLMQVYVALPYDVTAARELVIVLREHVPLWRTQGVRFFVRFHPIPRPGKVRIPIIDREIFFEAGPFRESAYDMDLLVCCNTALSLEGVAIGMPVVSYVPETTVCMDPAVDLCPECVHRCDVATLPDAIERWAGAASGAHTWAGGCGRTAADIFPPVVESVWHGLLARG